MPVLWTGDRDIVDVFVVEQCAVIDGCLRLENRRSLFGTCSPAIGHAQKMQVVAALQIFTRIQVTDAHATGSDESDANAFVAPGFGRSFLRKAPSPSLPRHPSLGSCGERSSHCETSNYSS